MPVLRYVDLFAGCGGLSTGFYETGLRGVFAIERNAAAFGTLKKNLIDFRSHFDWPAWLEVKEITVSNLIKQNEKRLKQLAGSLDVVCGGPPCQGFSTAGHRIESDNRNRLVHDYLKFLELTQPNCIVLENVRGFSMKFQAKASSGKVYSQIVLSRLRKLGYADARAEIFDLSKYGVPQKRKRLIIIATKNGRSKSIFDFIYSQKRNFLSKKGLRPYLSASCAISDLEKGHGTAPCADSARFISGICSEARTDYQRYLRTVNYPHVPDSHRFVNHSSEVEAVFEKLQKFACRNVSITGRERDKYGLKKRSVTVLSASCPSPTVTSIPDDMIHYKEPRVMTVRECARLQTFPDWFAFSGPYTTGGKLRRLQTPRYTQVGNAVPPLFAELIGTALKEVN